MRDLMIGRSMASSTLNVDLEGLADAVEDQNGSRAIVEFPEDILEPRPSESARQLCCRRSVIAEGGRRGVGCGEDIISYRYVSKE